jgi:Holliday junction DNA helicase RuvB
MSTFETIDQVVRAKHWDDYIGQARLKGHLETKIQAARIQKRMFDPTLLVAPPGAGKTTLSSLIAQRLGDPFIAIEMPISIADLIWEIEKFEGGVMLLDEIHRAPAAMQNVLHTALEGKLKHNGEEVYSAHCTFIAATTRTQASALMEPLVTRFRYRPTFEPYTHEELGEILRRMAARVGVDLSFEMCVELAPAAGGSPRQAQGLVAAARDLAATGNDITVKSVLEFAQVDSEGLTDEHMEYLRTLYTVGGRMGSKPLGNLLGLTSSSMESLERNLLLKGLIKLESNGRKITPDGKAKIVGPIERGIGRRQVEV